MDFNILQYISIPYMIITILSTYYILYKVIDTKNSWIKKFVSTIVNVFVSWIFLMFTTCTVDVLFASFTTSIVLYEWFIKKLLLKYDLDVNNNKGIKV